MVSQIVMARVLMDGGLLTLLVSAVLVGMLYFNPRLALSDYPADVRAAVPPRTRQELRLGILLTIPLLLILAAVPLVSVWLVKQQSGGMLTYGMAFATFFGEYLLFSLFDLFVLDWWMFYTWTPRFLVLPGTEGMAGYKDFRPHLKAQLTTGMLLISGFSAILALVATLVL